MSGLNEQNSRIQFKYSTITGATPTIAPSTDHTDGTWSANDIYVAEFYLNAADDTMWIRTLNGIIPITSGTTIIDQTAFVNKSGDTMTGGLYTPSLSAETVSATTIYSPYFSGTYYGDGSNLTGITSTIFTGGTVSGPVIFTSDVDLCGAAVTLETLSGCGGTIDIISDLNVVGSISATTFYGDGSNLTNLPSLSAITLDQVLSQGDTSTSGNIVLSGGSITLGTGIYYGDGSGLTNVPFGPTPTLDEVLLSGDTSVNGNILLTNGDIVLGNGIYYGDGSGLTNLPAATQTLAQVLTYGNTAGTNNIVVNTNYGLTHSYDDGFVVEQHKILFNSDQVKMVGSNDATTNTSAIGVYGTGDAFVSGLNITINPNIVGGSLIINGHTGFAGAVYDTDYSANFTNNSLITKLYVDNAVSAATSGITASLWVAGTGVESIHNINSSDPTYANGDYSLAVGGDTYANGYGSMAQGISTSANGSFSHAEGNATTALGMWSHAQGEGTSAVGDASFSSGYGSFASGYTSFVHGTNSNANGTGTIVLGDNIVGNTDNTVYVSNLNIKAIGSGTSVTNLGWDASGNVVSGGTSTKLQKIYTTITDIVEVDPQGGNTRIESIDSANSADAFVNVNSDGGVYLGASNASGLNTSIVYQGDLIRTYMNGTMWYNESNKNTISNSATTAILSTVLGQNLMVDYEAIIFGAATGGTDTFYYKINTVLRITGFGVVTEMPGATIVQKSIGTTNQSVSYAFTNPSFSAQIDWTANKGTSTDGWDWEIKEKYIIKNLN